MDIIKLIKSFKYAFDGVIQTIKEEQNFRIHLVIMLLVIGAGFLFKISTGEWFICLILFGLVISSEALNSAIENTVDLVTMEKREKAKKAKDAAAGAVLVNAIISAVIGFMIFMPKIIELIK